jgi:choline dehydrogenase-like flavoprotein
MLLNMLTITTVNNPSFTTCRSLLLFLLFFPCHASTSMIDEFDFIIIGGGTAGLTVANRLSELPNITVAIIEAGDSVFNNPLVTNPNDFTVPLGTSIDWQYQSTSQSFAAGQQIEYHSGKALGGTSTINGTITQNLS